MKDFCDECGTPSYFEWISVVRRVIEVRPNLEWCHAILKPIWKKETGSLEKNGMEYGLYKVAFLDLKFGKNNEETVSANLSLLWIKSKYISINCWKCIPSETP